MQTLITHRDFVPLIDPLKTIGKLNSKIVLKKDYVRDDGTCAVYLQLFQNNERKRIPLNISVPVSDWDEKKQLVKNRNRNADDYNLLIGKVKSDLNTVLVNYRLSGMEPKLSDVVEELLSPTLRTCFNAFYAAELEYQYEKGIIKYSTYRQQKGALGKIKKFRDPLPFCDIDENLVLELKAFCRHELKNKKATIEGTIKNFKKFLHLANKKRIRTKISFDEIKIKKMVGSRVFLLPEELKKLYQYAQSPFISDERRMILKRFLFSCFTGIRISDSERITEDNFIGDHLAFTMYKTDKFIRIKLNQAALSMIEFPDVFKDNFTREHINRQLKNIANSLGMKKRLHFHCSRHTFATNFLISGGDVVNLQRLLGHSKIEETMIYVHIVDSITDKQIDLLDDIIK
ncbi:site-specific integrase [Allomuricauda sp. ARW1Y1]|jgi:site-specific recombinase XerD|uniref:site-specific integrase n=1 Tax=Allomuricauda sp. ARW1Y1 TaxID=2663843 RepID=UPI0015CB80A9|nr:site-specific integrase [Muricauda sp. ARW1Y1]NYJ27499.1 site-specific recombinase XerD [Muricauda sp. ARW1Y1]